MGREVEKVDTVPDGFSIFFDPVQNHVKRARMGLIDDEIAVVRGVVLGPDELEGLSSAQSPILGRNHEWCNRDQAIFRMNQQHFELMRLAKVLPPRRVPLKGLKDGICLRSRKKRVPGFPVRRKRVAVLNYGQRKGGFVFRTAHLIRTISQNPRLWFNFQRT